MHPTALFQLTRPGAAWFGPGQCPTLVTCEYVPVVAGIPSGGLYSDRLARMRVRFGTNRILMVSRRVEMDQEWRVTNGYGHVRTGN